MLRMGSKDVRRAMALSGLVLLLAAVVNAEETDWPSWRGPSANGYSAATGLPTTWSATDSVVWKTQLPGVSAATPIIFGDRIFLNVGVDEDLELWALEAASGKVAWKGPLGVGNQSTRKQDMSSPSPVVDEERVVALTGRGTVKGFSHGGEELWKRDLETEYGAFGLNWGYASSPLLVDGICYIQVLHGARTDDPSYLIAINAATGETIWRVERETDAERESPDSYTTPTMLPRGGDWELVISGADYVTGHDPKNGKELWRVGGLNPERRGMYRIVATPTVIGDKLIVPSRVSPLLVLDVSGTGQPKVLWQLERGTDVPSPGTDGKSLFVVDDRGAIRRFDLETGEPTWEPQRLAQGNYSGSPVVADGKLYVTSETGVTSVIAIDGDFKLIAENQTDGYVLASPAVAGGRIFLRTDSALYSIGEK